MRQNAVENYLTPLSDDRKIKAKEGKRKAESLGNEKLGSLVIFFYVRQNSSGICTLAGEFKKILFLKIWEN